MPRRAKQTPSEQIALFASEGLPEPFKKAVAAIHVAPVKGTLDLAQRKFFDALLLNAAEQNLKSESRWFSIPITQLIEISGLNSNNRPYIKKQINSLIAFVVNWDYLSDKRVWNASGMISAARIEDGVVEYQFSDSLRELFTSPEIFQMIDMRTARKFSKTSTYAMWQNVIRYEGIGQTPRFKIDTLRDLIIGQDWPNGVYALYKEFKRTVLLPGVNEINKVSDHEIELVEFRQGRSVAEVQFKIRSKNQPEVIDLDELTVLNAVTEIGIPLSEARKLLSKHGTERLKNAAEYTQDRIKQKRSKPVENPSAYLRRAILNGWKLQSSGESVATSSDDSEQQAMDDVRKKFLEHRTKEIRGYFQEIDVTDQTQYINDYNDSQTAAQLKVNPGRASKAAESAFLAWLANKVWGDYTDSDLLKFLMALNKASA